MDELDRLLVNRLQHGLPLVRHPWEALAEELASSAETLRQRVKALLDDGTLTRFGPMFDVDRLGGAFTLAASLETPDAPLGIVLLSDGRIDAADGAQAPPGTRYEQIGERATNRAITRLSVEPRGSGLVALVSVKNTGGGGARQNGRFGAGRDNSDEREHDQSGQQREQLVGRPRHSGDRHLA